MKGKKIKVSAMVELPTVPDFLNTENGTLPLSAVSDNDLREIGKAWTEALVVRAHEQAKIKKEITS